MTPESEARPLFVIVAFIGTFALSRAGFEAHSSSGSWGGLETELEEVGHLDVGYSKEED